MTESATSFEGAAAPNVTLARRLARAVREASAPTAGIHALREAAREIAAAAAAGAARLTVLDGALLVDGAAGPADEDSALLAARLVAYGVEEITITPGAAPADLTDLLKLLGAPPTGDDPPATFAARSAVIDSRTIPRRLVPRTRPDPEPLVAAPPPRSSRKTPVPSAAAVETPRGRTPAAPIAVVEAPAAREDDSDLPRFPLSVPDTTDPRLAATLRALGADGDVLALRAALDDLAVLADLAFRTGRDDTLLEALAGLIVMERAQLERDPSDERRQSLTFAVRRLARPVLLRHLAVLRHRRAGEPTAVERLQAALHRFGTDGTDALIDEFASAPTLAARATIVSALRELRRTFDSLHALVRDADDGVVEVATALLGELGGPRATEMLGELLHHSSERVRRAALAANARLGGEVALEASRIALGDASTIVRARAVAALQASNNPGAVSILVPLLDTEPDREVSYAVVAALGALGGNDAVQALVRVAEGSSEHEHRRSRTYRILAATALVAIRTPAAMACVQGLTADRDREVKEAAVRLVAQAQRRSTGAHRVITG